MKGPATCSTTFYQVTEKHTRPSKGVATNHLLANPSQLAYQQVCCPGSPKRVLPELYQCSADAPASRFIPMSGVLTRHRNDPLNSETDHARPILPRGGSFPSNSIGNQPRCRPFPAPPLLGSFDSQPGRGRFHDDHRRQASFGVPIPCGSACGCLNPDTRLPGLSWCTSPRTYQPQGKDSWCSQPSSAATLAGFRTRSSTRRSDPWPASAWLR